MRRAVCLFSAVMLALGLTSIATTASAAPQSTAKNVTSPKAPANPAGRFHPTRSIRVFTTGSQPLAAGVVRKVAIAGHANLPTNIGAVEVNVTVLGPTKSGSLAVYPGTSAFNGYSMVSFTTGQTQQSMITANLGADGTLALRSTAAGAKLSVILDVVGYYVAGNATEEGTYHAIPTVRVSNPGQTGAIAPGATLTVSTGGKGAIPALVGSIVVNLTVQSPSRAGSVDIYDGPSRLSTFTVAAGTTVQRMATIRLDDGADFQLKNVGTASVVVIADAVGYFSDWRPPLGSGAYLDESDSSPATPSIAPLAEARFTAVPPDSSGIWAVRMEVQLLRPTKAGSISIYSADEPYAGVATVSFQAGSLGVHEVTSLVSAGGAITIRNNSSGTIKLTAAVVGQFTYQANPLSFSSSAVDFTSASGSTTGLSCPTTTFCLAVSSNGDAAAMTGTTWSAATTVTGQGGLSDVSCVNDQFCVAIGGAGVALYQQGVWSAPASIDPGQTLTALSCSSSGLCVVGDSLGRVLMYRAGSWSQPTVLGPAAVSALSCAPDGSCMSVLKNGNTTQYRNGAWRAVWISGSLAPELSCASASYCMAVSIESVATTWNGSTWVDTPGRYEDVDCPSALFCAGIDDAGGLVVWDGHYRSVELFPVVLLNDAVRIACPSTQTCFVSNGGRAVGTFSRAA